MAKATKEQLLAWVIWHELDNMIDPSPEDIERVLLKFEETPRLDMEINLSNEYPKFRSKFRPLDK